MPSQAPSQERARIAANLDRLIALSGQSNRQIADRIGATEHQVWRWRRGKFKPSQKYMVAIAEEFFGGDIFALYSDPSAA